MTGATPPQAFDVFISYSRDDVAWVDELRRRLEAQHVRVWVDFEQIRPGDRFISVLEHALTQVRNVVLVVSPSSVQSSWVQDEYHRALALSNGGAQVRLIAVLIGDVEPQGFMANRHWVDFRDPSRFEAAFGQLVFGLTGAAPAGTPEPSAALASMRAESAPATSATVDEVEWLRRAIARAAQQAQAHRRNRLLALLPGLAVAAVLSGTGVGAVATGPALWLGAPLVTALLGWGLTYPPLSTCVRRVEQFQAMCDGLETCRGKSVPGCSKLRDHFWTVMNREAGNISGPVTS